MDSQCALVAILLLGWMSEALGSRGEGGLSSKPQVPALNRTDVEKYVEDLKTNFTQEVEQATTNRSKAWEDYKGRFKKLYTLNGTEDARKQAQYEQALAVIQRWNSQPGKGAQMGLGPFADMTKAEFIASKLGLDLSGVIGLNSSDTPYERIKRRGNSTTNSTSGNSTEIDDDQDGASIVVPPATPVTIPDSVNWVANGKVVPVKEQGSCGSCWAFASVSTIESISAIDTGALYSLSEEQLIDCAITSGACSGAPLHTGFKYAMANGGLTATTAYPYVGTPGSCNTVAAAWKVVQISGYEWLQPKNETELMRAVAQRPVVVGIAASSDAIQYYAGGVLSDFSACCSSPDCVDDVNHAVVVVGYDKLAGYWIIRNSWGTGWGQEGYLLLKMGNNNGQNPSGMCGLLSFPVAPVKNGANVVSGTAPPGAELINLASTLDASSVRAGVAKLVAGVLGTLMLLALL